MRWLDVERKETADGTTFLEYKDRQTKTRTGANQKDKRLSCNFKIALVNQVQFSVRFVAAISQGVRTCLKVDAALAGQKLHRIARRA